MTNEELTILGNSLVGKKVRHSRFGDATIIDFSYDSESKSMIMIFQFEEITKSLSFPKCVQNNSLFYDKETASMIARAFNQNVEDYYVSDNEEAPGEFDTESVEKNDAKPTENDSYEEPIPMVVNHGKTISEALEAYNQVQRRKSITDESREKSAEKLRKAFVNDYPISRIKDLKLNEYLYAAEGTGYDDTFCTRFMNRLNDYGSLGNAFGDMYGVYVSQRRIVMNDSLSNLFGNSVNEAFEYMKESIVDLLERTENGEFEEPQKLIKYAEQSVLFSNFLLKLLAVYFPKDYLPVYADKRIDQYCVAMGISTENYSSSVAKVMALLAYKESTPEVSMRRNSSFMWFVDYCANSNTTIITSSKSKTSNSLDHADREEQHASLERHVTPIIAPAMKEFSGNIPDLREEIEDFVDFVHHTDGDAYERIDFDDENKFLGNPRNEGYKTQIAKAAREKLGFEKWTENDIGTGRIAQKVSDAISVANNLVERGHVVPIFKDQLDSSTIDFKPDCERVLYDIYCGTNEENAFKAATGLFGAKYALIAYLFFIKDSTRFLPVSPERFDKIFQDLNIDFRLSYRCSWENYAEFISIIRHIQKDLEKAKISDNEITLLNAHSFVWIRQYPEYTNWRDEVEASIAETERIERELDEIGVEGSTRKALVDQRVNQSKFRKLLLERYDSCCLCGVKNPDFLTASHIKPWSKSTPKEKTDADNGFLLCSNHDSLFDQGYISFDDEGRIILSPKLSKNDAEYMNVSEEISIRLTGKNKRYLSYHRIEVFKE